MLTFYGCSMFNLLRSDHLQHFYSGFQGGLIVSSGKEPFEDWTPLMELIESAFVLGY